MGSSNGKIITYTGKYIRVKIRGAQNWQFLFKRQDLKFSAYLGKPSGVRGYHNWQLIVCSELDIEILGYSMIQVNRA